MTECDVEYLNISAVSKFYSLYLYLWYFYL